jgi:metal-responsive CopG/Arc/MetJ family transcriptional regulator
MKTAISIPQETFESAEKYAARMGLSRSELYTTALKSYSDCHESSRVTEKLNQVYGSEDSTLDSSLKRLQNKSLKKGKW